MTFYEAGKTILPFGKHQTAEIDQVANTDEGLLYLDWMRGIAYGFVKEALDIYLEDESIKKDLQKAIENKEAQDD